MLPRHVSPSGVVIRRAKQYSQARVGTNLERAFHSYDEFIMYMKPGFIEKFINWPGKAQVQIHPVMNPPNVFKEYCTSSSC